MKNQTIIMVIIAVCAVLGIGVYVFSQNTAQSDTMMKKEEAMKPQEQTVLESANKMMKKGESAMEEENKMDYKMARSRYIEYTDSVLESTSGNRDVLFFYASWCPTCKSADENFRQNEDKIPADVRLIRVNYNDPDTDQEEKDLAKKYGITYQHTFVQIDSTGAEMAKWNGGEIEELLSRIK